MPKANIPVGKVMSKPRSQWGTVIPRYDDSGSLSAWQVRYPNPVDHGKKVQKQFKPYQEHEAHVWLENEHHLVDLHTKGIQTWVHPRDRMRRERANQMMFKEYVEQWAAEYTLPNGERIAGGTRRNLYLDIAHFMPAFEGLRLTEIKPRHIRSWYDGPHPEGQWSFRRACMRLKAVFRSATTMSMDGSPPLLKDNPFIFPIPPEPDSVREDIPPVTPKQLRVLAENMPDYTRLTVFLSTLAGGLRCGELCGLQVGDIDLDNKILRVRRSVNRGHLDRGEARFAKTKTKRSVRDLPIPDALVDMIREHLHTFCDLDDPTSPVFVPRRVKVMSQTTLEAQFARARKKAGRYDLMLHDLRASHATLLMLKGGTLREVMNQLGHASEKVAIKHYQRVVAEHQRQIVNLLADEFLQEAYAEGTQTDSLEDIVNITEQRVRELTRMIADFKQAIDELNLAS